ncbi:MAG: MazG-like family protein [Bacillota bacterium]
MTQPAGEIDIARNIRTIEWLKTELIGGIANLCKAMLKGGQELIKDALAGIIMTSYLLGRRIGISFSKMDLRLAEKLAANIAEPHEIEEWYGDFSALKVYLEDKNRGEPFVNRGLGK